MGSPRVSVVLPFHGHSPYLRAAVLSLTDQTETNLEIILVNNCASPDATEIAKTMAAIDTRIKLVKELKQGISFALNTGLKYARGQYIARLDADDLAHPDRLRQQANYLDANPHVGLVACQANFTSTVSQHSGFAQFVAWQNSIIAPHEHAFNRFIDAPVAHPTVMFRAQLVTDFGNYRTDGVPEDYELWLRWMDQGVQMAKIDQPLVTWADHPDRLSRTHPDYSKVAFMKIRIQYLTKWIKSYVPPTKPIVLCAGRRHSLVHEFAKHEVPVYGISDFKPRKVNGIEFVTVDESVSGRFFLVSLIAKQGVRNHMRELFTGAGLIEGADFILAG